MDKRSDIMPEPRTGESRDEAVAICNGMWEQARKAGDDTAIDTDDEPIEKFVQRCEFLKTEEHPDYTFVLGPVLVPEVIDKQGDIISEDEIELAAHDYMEDSQQPGLMHQLMLKRRDAQVVESYILRSPVKVGKRSIAKGTWMVAMRVYNDRLRKLVREGQLKGYSIGGRGKSVEESEET